MPIRVQETAGYNVYASPILGPCDHTFHAKLDVSTLTASGAAAQVDAKGFLVPGAVFKLVAGVAVPLDATSGEYVEGVVVEAIDLGLATIPPTNTSLGLVTTDPFIALGTLCMVQRDIAEDNLGRAYSAAEVAGFVTAGSKVQLTTT